MIETLIAVAGTLLLITAGTKAPKLVPQPVRNKPRKR
jgi:hypothetical protein